MNHREDEHDTSETVGREPGTEATRGGGPDRPRLRAPVGRRLRPVLHVVLVLFALVAVNSVYLAGTTFVAWRDGASLEGRFYLWNLLAHLLLGLALVVPTIVFGALHWRNVRGRPNPRAIAAGIATFAAAIVLLATGVALMRVEIGGATLGVLDPDLRGLVYWAHVAAPLLAIWLFVLHRLSGRPIRWSTGVRRGGVALAALGLAWALHAALGPRDDAARAAEQAAQIFEPTLGKTADGQFIPVDALDDNEYCIRCHADTVHSWAHSVHATSSFNNPYYLVSVRETRRRSLEREGSVRDARFCAGCHDPVPLFSGMYDDPRWDDPDYDVAADRAGRASITCTVCHAIQSVDSVRGNADYTLRAPEHYPLAKSGSPILAWISDQLVKAKPSFHKRTFLKPEVHRNAEFCSTCHKVFLPVELNDYKWLRGQNHYDPFVASGRSGHGVLSWNYPAKAATDCAACHMKPMPSEDFGSRVRDGSGERTILSHAFPAANTAVSTLVDQSPLAILAGKGASRMSDAMRDETAADAHAAIVAAASAANAKTLRVDLFAVRDGGTVDGALRVIRPELPVLDAGATYLLEVVVRTLDIGHPFTQGTSDSNETWLFARATSAGREIGTTGGLDAGGALDPWSRMFNVFMLDREGNRIARRNAQDIFVPLYNNQIPPGVGDVTHLRLEVPADASAPVEIETEVRYRKFDAFYQRYTTDDPSRVNDLPVMVLARDSVALPVRAADGTVHGATGGAERGIVRWERFYDYGTGLFREGDRGMGRGALRQAEQAFEEVRAGAPAVGSLALARLQFKEGRLDEAAESLAASAAADPPAPWTIAFYSALIDRQNGRPESALVNLRRLSTTAFEGAAARDFDFSRDVRVWNELAESALEAAIEAATEAAIEAPRGADAAAGTPTREAYLDEAVAALERSLAIDPEQDVALWLLNRALEAKGDAEGAAAARARHAIHKPDETAREKAVRAARAKYPWADHAAEATVIYDFSREGRFLGDLLDGTRTGPAAGR